MTSERLRSCMQEAGFDALVLSYPHDVLYATGYRSVLERWGQHEPMAAVVVAADPDVPVVLCLPEANVGLLAVLADQGRPDRAGELRVFELLNFCEVVRSPDPFAAPSAIGEAAMRIYGERVAGRCEPDVIASVAAALRDHGLASARIGFDDLRVGAHVGGALGGGLKTADALDAVMRARMVKTPAELEAFRRTGPIADAAMAAAAGALAPGASWSAVQLAVADVMIRSDAVPVDEGAMLFGGAFAGEFLPELFRTRSDEALAEGQIVILEVQGTHEDLWIDINRTATIGAPTAAYQQLHDTLLGAYEAMVAELRPGRSTGALGQIALDRLRSAGVSAPERLLVVAHGVGYMPLEFPHPFPSQGLSGTRGFDLEQGMVISLDALYFGSEHGPCHMENVFVIEDSGASPLYATPLALLGPR